MDSRQARLILACRRPNGQDDHDPAIREALEAARLDPALSRWLEQEQEIDALLGAKLLHVAPPEGLRPEILAGQTLVRPSASFWRRAPVWAAAACLALALGGAVWMMRGGPDSSLPRVAVVLPPATTDDMRQDVAGLVQAGFFPQTFIEGLDEARTRLTQREVAAQIELPPFLADATTYACSVIEWRGRKVAGICMLKDGASMHLFVLPKSQLDAVPREGDILTAEAGGLSTLTWHAQGSVYVLVGDTPDIDLRGLPGGGS